MPAVIICVLILSTVSSLLLGAIPSGASLVKIPDPEVTLKPLTNTSKVVITGLAAGSDGSYFAVGDFSQGNFELLAGGSSWGFSTMDAPNITRGFVVFNPSATSKTRLAWARSLSPPGPNGYVRISDVVTDPTNTRTGAVLVGTYRGDSFLLSNEISVLQSGSKPSLNAESLFVASVDEESTFRWVYSTPLVDDVANPAKEALVKVPIPVKAAAHDDGTIVVAGSFEADIPVLNVPSLPEPSRANTLDTFLLKFNATTGTPIAVGASLFVRTAAGPISAATSLKNDTAHRTEIHHVSSISLDTCRQSSSSAEDLQSSPLRYVVSGVSFEFVDDPVPTAVDLEGHLVQASFLELGDGEKAPSAAKTKKEKAKGKRTLERRQFDDGLDLAEVLEEIEAELEEKEIEDEIAKVEAAEAAAAAAAAAAAGKPAAVADSNAAKEVKNNGAAPSDSASSSIAATTSDIVVVVIDRFATEDEDDEGLLALSDNIESGKVNEKPESGKVPPPTAKEPGSLMGELGKKPDEKLDSKGKGIPKLTDHTIGKGSKPGPKEDTPAASVDKAKEGKAGEVKASEVEMGDPKLGKAATDDGKKAKVVEAGESSTAGSSSPTPTSSATPTSTAPAEHADGDKTATTSESSAPEPKAEPPTPLTHYLHTVSRPPLAAISLGTFHLGDLRDTLAALSRWAERLRNPDVAKKEDGWDAVGVIAEAGAAWVVQDAGFGRRATGGPGECPGYVMRGVVEEGRGAALGVAAPEAGRRVGFVGLVAKPWERVVWRASFPLSELLVVTPTVSYDLAADGKKSSIVVMGHIPEPDDLDEFPVLASPTLKKSEYFIVSINAFSGAAHSLNGLAPLPPTAAHLPTPSIDEKPQVKIPVQLLTLPLADDGGSSKSGTKATTATTSHLVAGQLPRFAGSSEGAWISVVRGDWGAAVADDKKGGGGEKETTTGGTAAEPETKKGEKGETDKKGETGGGTGEKKETGQTGGKGEPGGGNGKVSETPAIPEKVPEKKVPEKKLPEEIAEDEEGLEEVVGGAAGGGGGGGVPSEVVDGDDEDSSSIGFYIQMILVIGVVAGVIIVFTPDRKGSAGASTPTASSPGSLKSIFSSLFSAFPSNAAAHPAPGGSRGDARGAYRPMSETSGLALGDDEEDVIGLEEMGIARRGSGSGGGGGGGSASAAAAAAARGMVLSGRRPSLPATSTAPSVPYVDIAIPAGASSTAAPAKPAASSGGGGVPADGWDDWDEDFGEGGGGGGGGGGGAEKKGEEAAALVGGAGAKSGGGEAKNAADGWDWE
ncbi:hypothetical protein DFJ73DRAFT_921079 [Zopfochytrium polystomum]|nr:hypothetical protein DFJ73DRAFT_921079 [Zopfochytrium polystomum]